MTLQDFIKEKEIVGITKQKIPNKTMKKYLNHFKYIDTYELWYDDPDDPIYKTQNTKVQVLIDGELKECALVFTNNGSDFHLEPVKTVK